MIGYITNIISIILKKINSFISLDDYDYDKYNNINNQQVSSKIYNSNECCGNHVEQYLQIARKNMSYMSESPIESHDISIPSESNEYVVDISFDSSSGFESSTGFDSSSESYMPTSQSFDSSTGFGCSMSSYDISLL